MSKLAAAIVAGLMALSAPVVPAAAQSAPGFYCDWTANGTSATYTAPSAGIGCTGSLLGSGLYETLYIDILGRCTDTTVDSNLVFVQFNGDTGSNYDYAIEPGANLTTSAFGSTIGQITCSASHSATANAAGAISVKIPMADNTIFDKYGFSTSAFQEWAYSGTTTQTEYHIMGQGWHISTPAAISSVRIWLNPVAGVNFSSGTRFAIHAE